MKLDINYQDIISLDNLLEAWKEFLRGKRNKSDVQLFSFNLMDNIIALHDDLSNEIYRHGGYQAFNISDPRPRNIHKAGVRDRLVHHAIYRKLYPFFDRKFISDSYSCRLNKGTHRAVNRFRKYGWKVSKNNTGICWILKCDIRKFFASIDHKILKNILEKHVEDKGILRLLDRVIDSFSVRDRVGIGLPLGNLTSQLLVNVYMNEFDQFVKRGLKVKYYIRYADDFVVFSENRKHLEDLIAEMKDFLKNELKLELHPGKMSVKTLNSGIDFLGWVNFFNHRVLRTATKRRMLKRIKDSPTAEIVNSYLGLLRHGNTRKLRDELLILKLLR